MGTIGWIDPYKFQATVAHGIFDALLKWGQGPMDTRYRVSNPEAIPKIQEEVDRRTGGALNSSRGFERYWKSSREPDHLDLKELLT